MKWKTAAGGGEGVGDCPECPLTEGKWQTPFAVSLVSLEGNAQHLVRGGEVEGKEEEEHVHL